MMQTLEYIVKDSVYSEDWARCSKERKQMTIIDIYQQFQSFWIFFIFTGDGLTDSLRNLSSTEVIYACSSKIMSIVMTSLDM